MFWGLVTVIQTLKQHTATLGLGLNCRVLPDIQGAGDFLQPLRIGLIGTRRSRDVVLNPIDVAFSITYSFCFAE